MTGWRLAMQFVGIGWFIALSVIGGIAAGYWLDGVVGTLPLFTLLGAALGTVVAFYGMYRLLLPLLGQGGNAGPRDKDRRT